MAIYMKDAQKIWEKEYETNCRCAHPTYKAETLYGALKSAADKYPDRVAIDFLGTQITYSRLLHDIDVCADVLAADGIGFDDRVSVCLPNIPQTVIAFYAINKVGAVVSMIHPLSSPDEVEGFLKQAKSRALFTLDMLYPRLEGVVKQTAVSQVYISRIEDYLPIIKKYALKFANRKRAKVKTSSEGLTVWNDVLSQSDGTKVKAVQRDDHDMAALLFSGGTSSGLPKGIMLSARNFNVLGENLLAFVPDFTIDATMLTILPLFHGFGLGICVHAILRAGAKIVLIPQFSSQGFIDAIRKNKPGFIAGVPSMYGALMANKNSQNIDYSFLKGAFCGGDVVPQELKHRFDEFMAAHNGHVTLREGYGLTETVTACSISTAHGTPYGSFGIPMPQVLMKIVKPGTTEEIPSGNEGEMCISCEAVMNGYLDSEEENAKALRVHEDGRVWLHTGDMCVMDDNGFFYFKQRIKRILKVSGFPVYPSSIEDCVTELPFVAACAAIGIPDDRSGQRVRIYVVLKDKSVSPLEATETIKAHCREKMNKWSAPKEILFREELPLTRVGKVNIPALEEEAQKEKYAVAG